jgi:glycosyltransferase involved in cell wall biosynthesis
VHDLAIRRLPAAFPPLNRWGGWHLWSRLARRADHCIAISEATRRDLVAWAGVPRDRVTVIHHGVGRPFGPVPAAEVMRVRHAGRLHGGYFLAVGTIEPRKNLPRVIEALQVVRSSGSEAQLVVVGAPGWGQTRLQQQLLSGALGPSVRYVGHVPDADLAALYAGAIALVYPSLYEGFGLPILEAMACGCPVITSACGGLAEAAGDAARRVDPRSVPDIAAAMQALLVEPSQRTELARRGQQRATNFTWQRTAEHTLAVYRHVLETAHA